MRILLVRHAHAGVRGTWPGDDLARELSDRGRAEADALAATWADGATASGDPSAVGHVGAVHSSRAVRCTQTVQPLAERLGLEVVKSPQLLEGAAPAEALAWLESLELRTGHDTVVACSHGDVIGGILRRLADRGTGLESDLDWPKGSTWELEVDDGLVVGGRLHPPPELV